MVPIFSGSASPGSNSIATTFLHDVSRKPAPRITTVTIASTPHPEVHPEFGPPGWRIFRAKAHGGWDAPEPFMSDIGGLLPMAL